MSSGWSFSDEGREAAQAVLHHYEGEGTHAFNPPYRCLRTALVLGAASKGYYEVREVVDSIARNAGGINDDATARMIVATLKRLSNTQTYN